MRLYERGLRQASLTRLHPHDRRAFVSGAAKRDRKDRMCAVARVALIERNDDHSMALTAGVCEPNFSTPRRIRCRCQSQLLRPLRKAPLLTRAHLPRLWDPTAQNIGQSHLPIVCGSPDAEFWPQPNPQLPQG